MLSRITDCLREEAEAETMQNQTEKTSNMTVQENKYPQPISNTASGLSSVPSQSLGECYADSLADFLDALGQHRFWHVLPEGEIDIEKGVGVFDTEKQMLWPASSIASLRRMLSQNPFLYVHKKSNGERQATLHTRTRLLWSNTVSDVDLSVEKADQLLHMECFSGLVGWRLPTQEMLAIFAKDSSNPFQIGDRYRLRTANDGMASYWLTDVGCCVVNGDNWELSLCDGWVFACNPYWDESASAAFILFDMTQRGWTLHSPATDEVFDALAPDSCWQGLSVEALLTDWVQQRVQLRAESDSAKMLDPRDFWIVSQLAALDYVPCRLPKLDHAQLNDPEKGLWELWGEDPAELKRTGLMARDPKLDVQRRAVAIDFGTSSTVVAMDSPSGARELLRIGVRDFFQAVRAQDFENPTVLECVDYPAFSRAWAATAYRPALNWDWMRASHEAREHFRENPGDTKILSSILPLLKQWALHTLDQRRRLTDQQDPIYEMELAPHTERNPVRGQPLAVSAEDAFDPIELYAWYLGMAINWRGRGLFLKYYLSFPVKYPTEVKASILASFRRGLQRSLPITLINHYPETLNEFEVNDLATEPAAYAAAALPQLKVEPNDVGVPYSVFDFGGGTSDFDYGLLRWASPEEEAQGFERVFEHLGSSGDNFLGGENLLEHLVYESFKRNLDLLREKRIQFTQPLDAQRFAGSEAFLSKTLAAQTNTVRLAAELRGFLEGDRAELRSPTKLDLIDSSGNKHVSCEMVLDAEALDALLAARIRRGVEAFLAELARLSPDFPIGEPIQVLLSGNGSRSRYIKALFDVDGSLWQELLTGVFGEGLVPKIVVHPPLPRDDVNPHAPTAKTGVALGLLRLVPGENALLKNRLRTAQEGEAPFSWFVGRMRRGQFEPGIDPHATYGEWRELGPLQQGIFNLFFTNSPRARSLKEGDGELRKEPLDFPYAVPGSRLYARAVKPHLLELVAAMEEAELTAENLPVKAFALNS